MEGVREASQAPSPDAMITVPLQLLTQLVDSVKELGEKNEETFRMTQEELRQTREEARRTQEEARRTQEEAKQNYEKLLTMITEQGKEVKAVCKHIRDQEQGKKTYAQISVRTGGSTLPTRAHQNRGIVGPPVPPPLNMRNAMEIKVRLKDAAAVERMRTMSSMDMVKAVNQAMKKEKQGAIVAARQLKSGDIMLQAASQDAKNGIQQATEWLKALGQEAEMVKPSFPILVHGVRISSVDTENCKKTIEAFRAENHSILQQSSINRISWTKKHHETGKTHSSLVIHLNNAETANTAITQGLLYECRVHDCELYDPKCRIRQCFKCQNYGHLSVNCGKDPRCGFCAESHRTQECSKKEDKEARKCAACEKEGHSSWDRACEERIKEKERTKAAQTNRQVLYPINDKANQDIESITLEKDPEPTPFESSQNSQTPQTQQPKRGRPTGSRKQEIACSPMQPSQGLGAPSQPTRTQTGRIVSPTEKLKENLSQEWTKVTSKRRMSRTSPEREGSIDEGIKRGRKALGERDTNTAIFQAPPEEEL